MIEIILAYILARCINSDLDQTTVALISENLKISRSQVSVVLNKFVKENKLIRIESKPFCFISVEFLKEKSIPFKDSVYASLDDLLTNQEKKDFEKWKKFIVDEQLPGVQLFAGGWSKIAKDYKITGIPRFMVFGKDGQVVEANAPRPSAPELKELLEAELKK